MKYGCFNRKPIVTFGFKTCQYTLTKLGQEDRRCIGCKERKPQSDEGCNGK